MNIFTLPSKKYLTAICFLLFSWMAVAQLTVNVAVTDETCPGYGALSLSVSNANPAIPVVYKVYLLPEDTIPIWNSTQTNVPALGDGDYLVVATQDLGDGNTSTGQANATIGSLYVPVEFYISNSVATCSSGTDMTVTVTAGNPSTYEIISGPITVAPQASNVFSNVPSGAYEVRVTDGCNNGFTATHTFTVAEPTTLTLAGPEFPDSTFPSCDSININYTVGTASPSGIIYPLTVQLTVTPPNGGAPQVYDQTINTGNPSLLTISRLIDYYPEAYAVSISVTDPCGNVYESESTVNRVLNAVASVAQVSCDGQNLTINATNLLPPYTIDFTSVPAGFTPASFNANYPGPYSGPAVFGNAGNPVPLGNYAGTITDACGRTDAFTVQVSVPLPPTPQITAANDNCQSQLGRISIRFLTSEIETISIVGAPSAYTGETPNDLAENLNNGDFLLTSLPPGDYAFDFINSCGYSFDNIAVTVPEFSPREPEYNSVPDCTEGKGSIKISPSITAVTITGAPSGFAYALPYTASANIHEGDFSMDDLPPGNYSFSVNTECGSGYTETVEVLPLTVTTNSIEVQPTCNNFNIYTNYESNAGDSVLFWLQRFNDATNSWEHPGTGTPYTENESLTTENALPLSESNTGFTTTGEFRILRQQTSYCMASLGKTEKNCIEEIEEFEFYNELAITGIYNRTCVGEAFEVEVQATGITPHYELISKDGDTSFYVDNSTNNVFTNLEAALYVLRVTDACGEVRVEQFNIAELPPLITASTAEDMYFCDEAGTGNGTFNLSTQDDAVLGDVDPDIAIVTYHVSQQDADQDINPLPENYISGTATIYARVEWIVNPLCYGTSSFNIVSSPIFDLAMADTWGMCNGQPVTIAADTGYASYNWSTGDATESITVTEPGEYTVTVTNEGGCEVTKTVTAIVINRPLITEVDIEDWSDNNNTVTIITGDNDTSGYEYSFDGINYHEEAELTGVPAGIITVYVRDKFGCYPPDSEDVMIATYPKFFSPNGDGNNDTWRIKFAVLEPGLTVQVFDRYGKHITNFGATSEGWDGTFNGRAMPADDYWFIVKRGDGRELKGHFSIKR